MWLTDKLFGGRKSPEPLHLRVYGKLPFYQDFLGVRTDGRAASAFREWLDKGFAGSWEMGGREAGPMVSRPQRMLFLSGGAAVAAVVYDSHDRNRLREFPIAFFVEIPPVELAAEGLGPATLLEHVWDELAALHDEAVECSTAADFYDRFGRTVVTRRSELDGVREHLNAEWDRVGLAEWLESLTASADRRTGVAVVCSALEALRGGGDAVAVRIPLSPLLSFTAQADLWIRVVGRTPSLWLPQDGGGGANVHLSIREPRPWDARLFRDAPGAVIGEGGWIDAAGSPADPDGESRNLFERIESEAAAGGRTGVLPGLAAI